MCLGCSQLDWDFLLCLIVLRSAGLCATEGRAPHAHHPVFRPGFEAEMSLEVGFFKRIHSFSCTSDSMAKTGQQTYAGDMDGDWGPGILPRSAPFVYGRGVLGLLAGICQRG